MNEVNILDEIKAMNAAIEALVKLRARQSETEEAKEAELKEEQEKGAQYDKEIRDLRESARLVNALMEHNENVDAEKSHAANQKAETLQSTFDELVGAHRSIKLGFDDIEAFATYNDLTIPDEHQGTPEEPDISAAAG